MEQKPTIKSIKKCNQDSRTISLQETDDALGVEENWCSTFLSSSGLLAQGEFINQKLDERNALVTFRDPATAKVKGQNLRFFAVFIEIFFDLCL